MKRGGRIQRKTWLRAKAGFMKRGKPLRRSLLQKISTDTTPETKHRIQALLRALAIRRDGGCILRHYSEAGSCGGYRNDGELILQAEHLVTRSNGISYGDMRNIVCLCSHHHGHFKPQHGRLYWELVERHVGPKRWEWFKRVEEAHRNHRANRMGLWEWQKIEYALKQELSTNH